MKPEAIIFDFDGVLADSEIVSAAAFSRVLTQAGLPTEIDDALNLYTGLNRADTLLAIAAHWGDRTPPDIAEQLAERLIHSFAATIQPVVGAAAFVASVAHLPLAIGSSSSSAYIRDLLTQFALAEHFGAHVYSGREHVTRGKPHPDIYLHAAAMLGVDPRACVIIEDSPVGTRAAVAAGARVIGLCAGAHFRPGDEARLKAAGAHHIAADYAEVARLITLDATL